MAAPSRPPPLPSPPPPPPLPHAPPRGVFWIGNFWNSLPDGKFIALTAFTSPRKLRVLHLHPASPADKNRGHVPRQIYFSPPSFSLFIFFFFLIHRLPQMYLYESNAILVIYRVRIRILSLSLLPFIKVYKTDTNRFLPRDPSRSGWRKGNMKKKEKVVSRREKSWISIHLFLSFFLPFFQEVVNNFRTMPKPTANHPGGLLRRQQQQQQQGRGEREKKSWLIFENLYIYI